jgi:hypothetical protein
MYHIPLFAIAEGIVVVLMNLGLVSCGVYIVRNEDGLDKWVLLFGLFVFAAFLIGFGYLSVSSQVIEVFSKW